MSPSVGTRPAVALRLPRLPGPRLDAPFVVVHVGQSAAVLRAGDDSLAITSRERGLVPGGVCVPHPADFALVRRALVRRALTPGAAVRPDLLLADLLPHAVRVDLRVPPTVPDATAVAALSRAVAAARVPAGVLPDPRPLRDLAGPLARAALAGDDAGVADLLHRLVGSGPGATPAGDDVVVGVLAALGATPGSPAADARGRLARALPAVLHRTTWASRHDLRAAAAGQLAEHLHDLVRATADAALVPGTVARARTWGATSGLDHASGVAAAAALALPTSGPRAGVPSVDTHLRRSA